MRLNKHVWGLGLGFSLGFSLGLAWGLRVGFEGRVGVVEDFVSAKTPWQKVHGAI